jgi:hypothetical protein
MTAKKWKKTFTNDAADKELIYRSKNSNNVIQKNE